MSFISKLFGKQKVSEVEDPDLEKLDFHPKSPVANSSDVLFRVNVHKDGNYSFEVNLIPSTLENDSTAEVNAYAKWLAGSIARSFIKFDECVSLLDPDGVSKSTFKDTVGQIPFSKEKQ